MTRLHLANNAPKRAAPPPATRIEVGFRPKADSTKGTLHPAIRQLVSRTEH